jgi:PAS domain S-box-containing protein
MIVLALFLVAGIALLERRRDGSGVVPALEQAETLLIALLGLALSLGASIWMERWERIRGEEAFRQLAASHAERIRGALTDIDSDLETLARALARIRPESADFRLLAMPSVPDDGSIRAIGWAPAVALPGGSPRTAGISGFLRRPWSYRFPIRFVAPPEGNSAFLEADLARDPFRRTALLEAFRVRRARATAPVHPLTGEEGWSIAVYYPVCSGGGGASVPLGVLGASIRPEALLRGVPDSPPGREEGIRLVLADLGPDGFPNVAVFSGGSFPTDFRFSPGEGRQVYPLLLYGRAYALVCAPDEGFLKAHAPRWSRIVLLMGLLLTGLLCLLILNLQSARGRAESLARRRTGELRRTEERYRFLVENNRDVLYSLDSEGRITFVSRGVTRALGYRPEEMEGNSFTGYLHPEDRDGAVSFFENALRQLQALPPIEFRIRHKDGHWRWHTTNGAAVPDMSGHRIALVGVTRDTTELRETREQLVRAKDAAEAATEAKSRFLAVMSHEIRTPLNAVIAMTELLCEAELPAGLRRYGQIARSSAEGLLLLINDILDFSKIEAGKMRLEATEFSLEAVLEEALSPIAFGAARKGLDLNLEEAPDLPKVLIGDPGRLRQILLNLGGNAVKFTERGEILIGVEAAAPNRGEATLTFRVQDSGIGVPEDRLASLFLPFTQADASTTRRYGGTGLGLAISRSLVELMGGSIEAKNRPEGGTVFSFTVGFRLPEEGAGVNPGEESREGGIFPRRRLLLVSPSASTRRSLGSILSGWGIRPVEAETREGALEALRAARRSGEPFHLLLLEPRPELEESTFLAALEKEPFSADLPLLRLDPPGSVADEAELLEKGYRVALAKPIHPSALRDALLSILVPGGGAGRSPVRPERRISSDVSGSKILLVEDNPVNREVAQALLGRLGYRAEEAVDGREALEALKRVSYDLVLMDVQMPEMDGFAATAAIRDPRSGCVRPDVPIVALTADALQGDRDRCLAAGMDDYLAKPIRSADLRRILEKYLSRADVSPKASGFPLLGEESSPGPTDVPPSGKVDRTGPLDWDRERFEEATGGDETLKRSLLLRFSRDLPDRVALLRGRIDAGDYEEARGAAHGLKGLSAVMGADALAAASETVEAALRRGDPEGAGTGLDDLDAAFGRISSLIAAELAEEIEGEARRSPEGDPPEEPREGTEDRS